MPKKSKEAERAFLRKMNRTQVGKKKKRNKPVGWEAVQAAAAACQSLILYLFYIIILGKEEKP
jgi:hypothetical protein